MKKKIHFSKKATYAKLLLIPAILLSLHSCSDSDDGSIAPEDELVSLKKIEQLSEEEEKQFFIDFLSSEDQVKFIEDRSQMFSDTFMENFRSKKFESFNRNSTDLLSQSQQKLSQPSVDGNTSYSLVSQSLLDKMAEENPHFISPLAIANTFNRGYEDTHGHYPNKLPHGVYVNMIQYKRTGNPQNPNDNYGWWAEYKVTGTTIGLTQLRNQVSLTPWKWSQPPVQFPNATSEPATYNLSRTISDTKSINFTRTSSHNAKVWIKATGEGEFGFKLALQKKVKITAEVGAEYTYDLANSKQTVDTDQFTDVYPYSVEVPAGGSYKVIHYERESKVGYDYDIHLNFSGLVGADYGSGKYNGSHFWPIYARDFFQDYHNSTLTIDVEEDVLKEFKTIVIVYDSNEQVVYFSSSNSDVI